MNFKKASMSCRQLILEGVYLGLLFLFDWF